MTSRKKSDELFNRATVKIPGAVNSPVRAWKAVGSAPIFIESGSGATLIDADGNAFSITSAPTVPRFSAMLIRASSRRLPSRRASVFGFGAPTRLEVELAELISSAIECAQKVRLVSSGTEAGITALRLARAATGRPNIIKFDGCYHGHSDSMLVRAGSGAMTFGQPDSGGVPSALAAMTMVARYNSIETVEGLFRAAPDKIAAVIVEPVAANMGVVNPDPGSLKALAEIAHANGALLICDEVISGFRLRFGSIAESMGVAPDLIMLGKIIGGGMPVGARRRSRENHGLARAARSRLPGGHVVGKSAFGSRRTRDVAHPEGGQSLCRTRRRRRAPRSGPSRRTEKNTASLDASIAPDRCSRCSSVPIRCATPTRLAPPTRSISPNFSTRCSIAASTFRRRSSRRCSFRRHTPPPTSAARSAAAPNRSAISRRANGKPD